MERAVCEVGVYSNNIATVSYTVSSKHIRPENDKMLSIYVNF